MLDDYIVREQALLDHKNVDFILLKYGFHIVAILDFLKGLTHDFGQKLQISSSFVLGKNGPWSSV